MKRNVPAVALCASLAALAVAGCGGGNQAPANSHPAPASSAPNPGTTNPKGGSSQSGNLTIAADQSGQLKFDKKSLSAKAGKVTITMDNPSPVPHAIAVEGNGLDKDGKTVQMGGKSTVTVTLKAGKYTFYCPVDGHKQAGMQGPLTVK
jgi:plastocyanin